MTMDERHSFERAIASGNSFTESPALRDRDGTGPVIVNGCKDRQEILRGTTNRTELLKLNRTSARLRLLYSRTEPSLHYFDV